MATPHNTAAPGVIAPVVLMPGDPLRARFIAETYLETPVRFNEVRGMFGYTGVWHGRPVSVMGSGMGIPSIGIYSYELFTVYDVESIIRIGSAGSYDPALRLYDVILATGAWSESTYALCQSGVTDHCIPANPVLCERLRAHAARLGVSLHEGRVHSSDVFYHQDADAWKRVRDDHGCIAVEMESFGLFHNAVITGKKAACLLTVSDTKTSAETTTPEEREQCFTTMVEIALGIV